MVCCEGEWVKRLCGGASGLYGLTAVVMGALGAHLLGERLAAHDGTANFERAKLYFFVHGLILAAVALHLAWRPRRVVGIAGLCFAAGTAAFAGSLTLVSLTGWTWLTHVTPFGGVLLMSGWIAWAIGGMASSARASCDAD